MNLMSRVALLVCPVIIVTSIACTSESDDEVCKNGTQCVCKDSCSKTCESETGGDCQFVCQGGTCSFDCAGGNCQINCQGTASCNVSCPKGGCRVTGGTGKTDVKCGGLESCQVACSGPAESCLVDGKPSLASGGGARGLGIDDELPGLPPDGTEDSLQSVDGE